VLAEVREVEAERLGIGRQRLPVMLLAPEREVREIRAIGPERVRRLGGTGIVPGGTGELLPCLDLGWLRDPRELRLGVLVTPYS
jgi:hypothetical protein